MTGVREVTSTARCRSSFHPLLCLCATRRGASCPPLSVCSMIALLSVSLALLLARGVLASNASNATVLTANSDPAPPPPVCARVSVDAFAALAKAKDTGPPMCSVRANMYSGMNNDAEILSFEEWKALQLQLQNSSSANQPTPTSSVNEPERTESPTVVEGHADAKANLAQVTSMGPVPATSSQPTLAPSVLPSLKDRYNFASTDCSARVQGSHKGARSPDAILSHKKDRYMLSPCATKEQHVMVELCDDIRIDTVQLANFEFFSGVFRRFQISVSTDGREWENAGEYEAKNVRGVQVSLELLLPRLRDAHPALTVLPSADGPVTLLSLPEDRLFLPLWQRVLLPGQLASCLWAHADGEVQAGTGRGAATPFTKQRRPDREYLLGRRSNHAHCNSGITNSGACGFITISRADTTCASQAAKRCSPPA